jgi:hypothetical protein
MVQSPPCALRGQPLGGSGQHLHQTTAIWQAITDRIGASPPTARRSIRLGRDKKGGDLTYWPLLPLAAAFARFCFTLSFTMRSIKPYGIG